MKTDFTDCVQGFSPCVNKTFTNSDFRVKNEYTETLVPGFGCFLSVDRALNGTWGQLRIKADNVKSKDDILVFDDQLQKDNQKQQTGLVEYVKGLIYTDDGWLSRKIFIVNINENTPAKFTYTYEAAVFIKTATAILISGMSALYLGLDL